MSKSKTNNEKRNGKEGKPKKNAAVRYLSFELREFRRFANPARFQGFFFFTLILMAALPVIAFGCYVYTWIENGNMASQSEAGNSFVFLGAMLYFRVFLILGMVMLAGALLYMLVFPRSAGELKQLFFREPWHFLLFFLLLWSVPGLLLSADTLKAWTGSPLQYDGLRTYLVFAAVYLAACFLSGRGRRLIVLRVFTAGCTFCTFLMFGQIYQWPVVYDCLFHTASSVMVNLNHFGYYLCTSIALLAGLFLYDRGKKRTVWYGVSFAFQVFGLLFNDTFGSYVAAAFALAALAVFHWRSGRPRKEFGRRIALLTAVFIALSVFCYLDVMPSPTGRKFSRNFSQFSSDVSSLTEGEELDIYNGGSGRLLLWKEALELIPQHPLVGFGPNGMPDTYDPEYGLTRPHNSFIQIAVFHGIPGAAAFIAALIILLLRKWKELEELDESVLVSAGGTAAFLVSSFFGVPMFYTSPYLFLLLGFVSTPDRRNAGPESGGADADTDALSGAQAGDAAPSLAKKPERRIIHWKRLLLLVAGILAVAGIAAYLIELRLEKIWEEQDILLMRLAYMAGQAAVESDGLTVPVRLWYEPEEGVLVSEPVFPAYGAGTKLKGYDAVAEAPEGFEQYDVRKDYSGKILEVEINPRSGGAGVTVRWVPVPDPAA